MPWPAPDSSAAAASPGTEAVCTAATSASMPAAVAAVAAVAVAAVPATRTVRRRSRRTANCAQVAQRNIAKASAPETTRLPVPSSPDSSEGPSDRTKDVAVMPGAKTAMPRASGRPAPRGTPGTRIQAPLPLPLPLPLPVPASASASASASARVGRRSGIRSTTAAAVTSRTASTANTVTVGAGSVCDSTPAGSGPQPAPKTIAQEASSAASGRLAGPATSVTAAMPAETAAPTATPKGHLTAVHHLRDAYTRRRLRHGTVLPGPQYESSRTCTSGVEPST